MTSKRDYENVARILREAAADERTLLDGDEAPITGQIADRLADYFAADNPAFDRARFSRAIFGGGTQ